MGKVLKLYFDRKYLLKGEEHVEMLYPFLGPWDHHPFVHKKYEAYVEHGKKYFEPTKLEDCDFAVFPAWWELEKHLSLGEELCEKAAIFNKKVIFFSRTDYYDEVPFENAVIFRTHLHKAQQKKNEFAYVGGFEDLVDYYNKGQLVVRAWQDVPVIGFCGHVDAMSQKDWLLVWANEFLVKYIPGLACLFKSKARLSKKLRQRVIRRLKSSSLVQMDDLVQEGYFGSAFEGQQQLLANQYEVNRRRFYDNMFHSDYALCMRGAGNFSHRFYEAMCMGRIPVFINTGCVLPYNFIVDWKAAFVWIELDDLYEVKSLDKEIIKYHSSLTEEAFLRAQQHCRSLWQNYLSLDGFFKHFSSHFDYPQVEESSPCL